MPILSVSKSFTHTRQPVSATGIAARAYVLAIATLRDHYAAAASAPSDKIILFDKLDGKTIVRTLDGHEEGINCMRTVDSFATGRDVLLSCGKDGTVKAWDERTGAVATQMLTSGRKVPLLSCDASSSGLTIAAGAALQGEDAAILYWDPRNPIAPLRRHASTHSDDITAVHFGSSGPAEVLLSASTDGLLCTSNPLEPDEDEAGIHVGNWGCSISKAGWIHGDGTPGAPRVWASSDMETLSIWSDELDVLQDVDRERLTRPYPNLPWTTDYIIDCHSSPKTSFRLFAGSNEGDIAMISPPDVSDPESQWSLDRLFMTKHKDIVRCATWDEPNNLLLTGGEDWIINVWECPGRKPGSSSSRGDAMDIDEPRKRFIGGGGDEGLKRARNF